MQSALFRIWTRVAVSISNDDNHYATGTSTIFVLYPEQVEVGKDPIKNVKISSKTDYNRNIFTYLVNSSLQI